MARIVIGDVIAGKYCVERAIAEGSTGTIFLARHLELDQQVAIKVLFEEVAARSVAAERFRREARAAARMQGPHVCRVLDIGAQADGSPFMVMEYLEGCHLGRELERRGRLTPEEAFECILQACDAVAEAHAAGIVHRDIKPANLFWATLPDGSRHIKVLGFGVSNSAPGSGSSPGQPAITISPSVSGSPAYLSPEQLDSSQDVDERTDIWALAVVFYELISGRVPFYGDSVPSLVRAVLNAKPKPLSELQVGAPTGLDAVFEKALSKRREQRYSSIAEFVSAIVQFAPISAADTAHDLRRPYAQRISRAQTLHRSHLYGGVQSAAAVPAVEAISPATVTSSGRAHYGALGIGFVLALALGVLVFHWAGSPRSSGGDDDVMRDLTAPAVRSQLRAAETSINASQARPEPLENVLRPAPAASAPAGIVAEPVVAAPQEANGAAQEGIPQAAGLDAKQRPAPAIKPQAPAAVRAPAPIPTPVRVLPAPAQPYTDFGGRR